MPTYDFKSNKTGKEWEDTMSWKDLDQYSLETVKMFYDDAQQSGFSL